MSEAFLSRIRIGTRNSPMAIAFAEITKQALLAAAPDLTIDIGTYVSDGDRIAGSLAPYGGKGTFVKDLEQRLLSGEIDLAVHSLKDVPGDVPMHEDLAIGAYLKRHDPRDCLVLRGGVGEADLSRAGARIGTSAPRRQAALRLLLPHASCELIRGNVNTRLRKLDEGQYDALVLAGSGLSRLGMESRISRYLSAEEMLPAIGQGIMCLQVRRADMGRMPALAKVNDAHASYCAAAEREILHILKGNCHSAIAGLCEMNGQTQVARLRAMVFDPAGGVVLAAEEEQSILQTKGAALGARVAASLLAQGAAGLL